MRPLPKTRTTTLGLALTLALATPLAAQDAGQRPPAQVGFVTLAPTTLPVVADLPGRAVAYRQTEIRPRVDGLIEETLYQPGQLLPAGTPLFRLDDASYAATVAADEAAVAEAQADLPVKQAAYDRAVKLLDAGVTRADLETAQSNLAAAKATLQSAEAALGYARTQLSWTTIRTPFEGVVEVASASVGDLVTAGQSDALTTITALDPIEVDMIAPGADVLAIQRRLQSGALHTTDRITANLTLEDGETYQGSGNLVAPSATISTSTGTVSIRFRFENPDRVILPGAFVRGTVTLGSQEAYLVPQRAGSHAADGLLHVFLLGEGDVTRAVTLKTEGSYQNGWIVREGLAPGDRVVVTGQKNLQADAKVIATAVTLDDDGQPQAGAAAKAGKASTGKAED